MKASELRIDNWVNSYDNNGYHQVDADDILYCATDVGSGHFDPIPLTEEWLLKLGFEIKDLANYVSIDFTTYQKGKFVIADNWEVEYDTDRLVIGYDLKYVHQLQNLYFALEGTELEIKP